MAHVRNVFHSSKAALDKRTKGEDSLLYINKKTMALRNESEKYATLRSKGTK